MTKMPIAILSFVLLTGVIAGMFYIYYFKKSDIVSDNFPVIPANITVVTQ